MKHITVDEIIDFVTDETLDAKSMENASKVTAHICKCSECLKKVQAFQKVYEEFERLGKISEYKLLACEMLNKKSEKSKREEVSLELED